MPTVPLQWDGASDADDADVRSICISASASAFRYASGVLMEYADRFPDRGLNDETDRLLDHVDYQLQAYIKHIALELLKQNPCGEGEEVSLFRLRQSSDDPCILEQTFDAGGSWSTAFNYAVCQTEGSVNSTVNQFITNSIVQQQFNTWNEATTIHEIHQDAPDDTFNHDTGETTPEQYDIRLLALCNACKLYVYGYCEVIREINRNASSWGNLVFLAMGAVAALAAFASIVTVGGATPLFYAAVAAMGALGIGAYSAFTEDVLNNSVAKDEVVCLLFNQLKDQTPTPDALKDALDSTSLSGDAEIIRSTLAVDMSNEAGKENQFNAFMSVLGESKRPAELGLIDDCDCFVSCYHWDFGVSVGEWDQTQGNYVETSPNNFYDGEVVGARFQMTLRYNFFSPIRLHELRIYASHADMYLTVTTNNGAVITAEYKPSMSGIEHQYDVSIAEDAVEWVEIFFDRDVPDGIFVLHDAEIDYAGLTPTGGESC